MEKENFVVAESAIHGFGVFTRVDIPANQLMFILSFLRPLRMSEFGTKVNHSTGANIAMVENKTHGEVWMYSLRNIKAGEELLLDYRKALPYYNRDVRGLI